MKQCLLKLSKKLAYSVCLAVPQESTCFWQAAENAQQAISFALLSVLTHYSLNDYSVILHDHYVWCGKPVT